ncbi:hypothetical protein GDO78_021252 [Eleutherodactylus coqui]|uniref:Uncharacterized protein n=1 Tax=Eleutherodactylus coqui TaxID=57060 RepID=A0A8J6B407_ELECQ|nr:hypothetical protein GDO78_021252 [Eleutherodactylus coqui]
MSREIRDFVNGCSVCARSKSRRREGPLRPLPVPSHPWSHLTVDFITNPPEPQKFTTILVVIDSFSKMAHFMALKKLPSAIFQDFCKRNHSSTRGSREHCI